MLFRSARISYYEIIGVKPIVGTVPNQFILYQNYPNPFNPVTKIKFSLPNPSESGVYVPLSHSEELGVRLIIYDILGREVATLILPLRGGYEELKPGTYEVEWNASNYPSGVYFYRLTIKGYTETKKMVLLK